MYPPDVSLPPNAKYLIFSDNSKEYNAHWDIVWSISYALTGNEHALCTYLTDSNPISSVPGHYLGYTNQFGAPNGFLAIAFDTTGYFAVSSEYMGGIRPDEAIPNSLIIRNGDNLLYNSAISSIDTSFNITETDKTYKILRFRVLNGLKKLYIDYKIDNVYENLLQISLSGYNPDDYDGIFPVFSYTSPVSSSISSNSVIWMKNSNIYGETSPPSSEDCLFTPLSTGSMLINNTLPISKK